MMFYKIPGVTLEDFKEYLSRWFRNVEYEVTNRRVRVRVPITMAKEFGYRHEEFFVYLPYLWWGNGRINPAQEKQIIVLDSVTHVTGGKDENDREWIQQTVSGIFDSIKKDYEDLCQRRGR